MNKIPNELNTYLSSIQKVEFNNSTIIFYTKEGVYLYLPVSCERLIYSYLEQIDFNNCLIPINDSCNYSLFKISSYEKTNPIDLLCELYKKSSQQKRFSVNEKSQIANRLKKDNVFLMNYYHDMQDRIEEMYYPMESFYKLLLNISQIYKLLFIGNYYLDRWMDTSTYYDEVLVLKNIDAENFIDNKIIDFSRANRDYYVFELANYYKKYYLSENIINDISFFEESFKMSDSDRYLFYGLISIIWEIDGAIIEEVNNLNRYVKTTLSYLLKKYEKDQQQEEDMLEEK